MPLMFIANIKGPTIKASNEKVNIPYSKFGAKECLLNKGVCLRLGLVKSNYVSFDRKNPKVKVFIFDFSSLNEILFVFVNLFICLFYISKFV